MEQLLLKLHRGNSSNPQMTQGLKILETCKIQPPLDFKSHSGLQSSRGEDTNKKAVSATLSLLAREFHILPICPHFGTARSLVPLPVSRRYPTLKVFSLLHYKPLGRPLTLLYLASAANPNLS